MTASGKQDGSPGLRDRTLLLPSDFIDRDQALGRFRGMLSRRGGHRILELRDVPESGKTYLLVRLKSICRARNHHCALLDLDPRGTNCPAYFDVAQMLISEIGEKALPQTLDRLAAHNRPQPLVDFTSESCKSELSIGSDSRLSDAKFAGSIIGNMIHIRDAFQNVLSWETAESRVERRQQRMSELGRAIRVDLKSVCCDVPVVLLLDSYEMVSIETAGWIENWILDLAADPECYLLVVLAGRPAHRQRSSTRPVWHAIRGELRSFSPPHLSHIREYVQLSNLPPLGKEVLEAMLREANKSMGALARYRDRLRRRLAP